MSIANFRIKPPRLKNEIITAIAILATLIPILNIVVIIATTGANNFSNDYIQSLGIIDQFLSGTYDWNNYFQDTFFNGHIVFFPALIRLAIAYFAHSNVYVEFYISVIFFFIKLILLHDIFAQSIKPSRKWLLLPILSCLVFSTSQISVFTFGYAALEISLCMLGFTLGMWGLVKFSGSWLGVVIMLLGGILASWSFGFGLMAWLAFLLGLILLKFRKAGHYIAYLITFTIASSPYFFFFKLQSNPGTSIVPTLNLIFIPRSIGLPLAQGFALGSAQWIGFVGIILLFIQLYYLWQKHSSNLLKQAAPALMLVSFALLSILQVTIFRANHAPWYTTPSMNFWIGLVGSASVFLINRQYSFYKIGIGKFKPLNPTSWSFSVLTLVAFFYVTSNLTYEDKVFHLPSRSPSSAACLREYLNAPTYCEERLFQWGLGNTGLVEKLATPLDRHKLSVFSPRQRWTLQGDFVLDKVSIEETPEAGDIFWSENRTIENRLPWHHYKHLNLFLPSPNTASWTISLPNNLKSANFNSAVAVSKSAPKDNAADGLTFEVYIEKSQEKRKLAYSYTTKPNQSYWQPFSISLNDYVGETVTLHLTSSSGKNSIGDWGMYRYPYIDVLLNSLDENSSEELKVRPSNTDISSLFTKTTSNDFRFDVTDINQWEQSGLEMINKNQNSSMIWKITDVPNLTFIRPLNVQLNNYTHFYISLAVSPAIAPRALTLRYKLDDGVEQSIPITLLADGNLHEYTYDLKLLELDQTAHLTSLSITPVIVDGRSNIASISHKDNWVNISDIRLISKLNFN
ncbi:MAG: hypothetical protein WBG70_05485 [Spirulinaceae cyanobacterium]